MPDSVRSRAATVGIWVVSILLLIGVGPPGMEKLVQPDAMTDRFVSQWGLPAWLVPVTGVMEALGGLLILVPRLSSYGAVMVFAAMVGATGTLLAHGELNRFAFPLVLAILAGLVGWARGRDAIGPLGTGRGHVSHEFRNVDLETVLRAVLDEPGLRYRVVDDNTRLVSRS